jgi:hypothetical protein
MLQMLDFLYSTIRAEDGVFYVSRLAKLCKRDVIDESVRGCRIHPMMRICFRIGQGIVRVVRRMDLCAKAFCHTPLFPPACFTPCIGAVVH